MNKKRFLNVADVAAVMGVSVPTAYEIIHRLNDELSAPGFITVAGKVSRTEGAALGHTWVDATCTTPKTCSVCGETEGEALGHDYDAVVTDPTCTEGGYTTYTCSVCGDHYTDDAVEATGHNWSDEWSFDEDNHWRDCTICGEDAEVGGHSYENGSCIVCGVADPDVPTATFTPTFSNGSDSTEVTTGTTENGTKTYTFLAGTKSSAPYVTVTAPADGWKVGENIFTVASTNNIACVVIVKDADGNYTRLSADTDEETGIHSFAAELDEDCEIIIAVLGDLNGDGQVNGRDAAQMQRIAVKSRTASEQDILICDINGDGKINGRDAAQIQRVAVKSRTLAWNDGIKQ